MAALPTPSMATIILLLLLLLIPTGFTSNANNDTASASASCKSSHPEKWPLVGEEIVNSEFLMESEIGQMLLDFNIFQITPNTRIPTKPVVICGRPSSRYQSCLGEKRQIPPKKKCNNYNRAQPCQ